MTTRKGNMLNGLRWPVNAIHGLYCRAFGALRGSLLWQRVHRHTRLMPGTLFSVNVPGLSQRVYLRASTSDVTVFLQIFVERELDILLAHPVEVIVDAGANIGLSSVYLANRYPLARILSIEVEAGNFSVLARNVAGYPNITPLLAALWTEKGYVRVVNSGCEPWAFRVEESTSNQSGAVPCLGVSDVLKMLSGRKIDLFKIDVEGAEKWIFSAGASDWLRHVQTLIIETHERFVPGSGQAVELAVRGRAPKQTQSGEYQIYSFGHDVGKTAE